MAKKKIIWSLKARKQQFEILEYYSERNGNDRYSIKLYQKFQNNLSLISKLHFIGKPTDKENIRFLIVSDYQIFYEIKKHSIEVLLLWDCRQDPDKFPEI